MTRNQHSKLLLCGIAAVVFSIVVISCDGANPAEVYIMIYSEADLQMVRNNLTGNFRLMNNINLDVGLNRNFKQIAPDRLPGTASYQGEPFTGTFDGNNKTISEVRIVRPLDEYVGFFGKIGKGGIVRNLRLVLADGNADKPSIAGTYFVGALAGSSEGVISNVGVEGGYVKGTHSDAGGLVGYMWKSSITKSYYVTGTVSGIHDVGGLAGDVNKSKITNSYTTGTVSGVYDVGGLVGEMAGRITNSYATGIVSGVRDVGGLVGYMFEGWTTASYFDVVLTGQTQGVGDWYFYTLDGISSYYTYAEGNQKVYTEPFGGGNEIEEQTQFPGWDFTAIWIMQEGEWPTLRSIQP